VKVVRIRSLAVALATAGAVLVACIVLVSTVLVSTDAVASQTDSVRRVGSCRARGHTAGCGISGSADHPVAVFVHAGAGPRQRVTVGWWAQCFKHGRHKRARGSFRLRTPVRYELRLPFSDPAACTVTTQGVLRTGGSLHLWVTSRT
jgi:hypothetical protein